MASQPPKGGTTGARSFTDFDRQISLDISDSPTIPQVIANIILEKITPKVGAAPA